MLNLSAKTRKEVGKNLQVLREKGVLPGILYGPKIKNIALEVDLKEFEKVYKETGESSLFSLDLEGKKFLVLIYGLDRDPVSEKPIHVDFYQPKLDEEIETTVPLVFEGESAAVKDFGGTLVKNIHEVEVKALPQNLPHEIKVSIEALKTFEDNIFIKDLIIPKEVKIMKEPEEIVAHVAQMEKVEEELEKPLEEKVEDVEKAEKEKEEKTEGDSEEEK